MIPSLPFPVGSIATTVVGPVMLGDMVRPLAGELLIQDRMLLPLVKIGCLRRRRARYRLTVPFPVGLGIHFQPVSLIFNSGDWGTLVGQPLAQLLGSELTASLGTAVLALMLARLHWSWHIETTPEGEALHCRSLHLGSRAVLAGTTSVACQYRFPETSGGILVARG